MKKKLLFLGILCVISSLFYSCAEESLPEPQIMDLEATGNDNDGDYIPPPKPLGPSK